jgi:hypothetical protein
MNGLAPSFIGNESETESSFFHVLFLNTSCLDRLQVAQLFHSKLEATLQPVLE